MKCNFNELQICYDDNNNVYVTMYIPKSDFYLFRSRPRQHILMGLQSITPTVVQVGFPVRAHQALMEWAGV